ncbi:BTAD domain-containing putative transcriptional regulator [Aldersonia kunmingensis]|uniref:BTAD domain-containing putative transcriptional regulator n=1 Tax=Aldersonia kunmingensis TaxID=408066 RepID=UPI00082E1FAA|nr:BTAD domain-containing putative transcriptional regulator [Aldersonia kunmingensis]
MAHSPPIRVELLGPLRLLVDGAAIEVSGTKRRAVLALLAIAEGRVVTVDRLIDALWPAQVPDSGRQALHNHVSRLRAQLGPAAERLETGHEGYRLILDPAELDVTEARMSLAAAQRDSDRALTALREAHQLWRGPVLADLVTIDAVANAAEEYERLHRDVVDALIDAAVVAGQADEIVGMAATSAAADPLRENAVRLHMRALAATGDGAEGLRIGREYRRRLAEETGLDPTAALAALERDIAVGTASAPAPALSGSLPPTGLLIGRDDEIALLRSLLENERLVTIVGPGGVGKTRIGVELAAALDGSTVVLLAPITDPAALPLAVAGALELEVEQGDVLAACVALLGNRPGLLVVDNCEHVLAGARSMVEAILAGCPAVTVLATSREPLGLAVEYVHRLAPLALPEPDRDASAAPSVALFVERARRVRPGSSATPTDTPMIADIVRRLDGMPLAIELAAGRLSTFSLSDLRDRLDRSLDLLGAEAAGSRHATLRSTVEWSYRLLNEDERQLFRNLAVFTDGFDLGTAERIAADLGSADDPGRMLARLVDTSMIDVTFASATRYRMLETLRAFGRDRLAAANESAAAERNLVHWAVDLCTVIGAQMSTDREPDADAVLRRELGNLRTAWRLARAGSALDDAAAMIIGLFDAVAYRNLVELRDWAIELADDPRVATHPQAATLLGIAAEAVYHRGDYLRADQLARSGLAMPDAATSWHCLMALSVADLARGAFDDVVEHSLSAAVRTNRENLGIAALATAYAGDLTGARALNDRGLAGAQSPSMRSWGAYVYGEIDSLAGNLDDAERHYQFAIELARGSGATFLVGVATVGMLSVRAGGGRVSEALAGYREVIDSFARTGNWTHLWTTLRNLAGLLRTLGDHEVADRIDAAADAAPDAPAVAERPSTAAPRPDIGRAAVLGLARQAIARHLTTH